jgi:hypothetical protein
MNMQELKQPQELPEPKQNNADLKNSYETPTLTKLGTVQQVTQGADFLPVADSGMVSW